MRTLVSPTTTLHAAWLAARDDWGRGVHQDGAGLHEDDEVDSPAGFAAWVARLTAQSSGPVADGRIPATYWWIVENGTVLGAITLRHHLNARLLEAAGHIGFGVRPSARGRGVASWGLARVLDEARTRRLPRVLLSCGTDNPASARVIERNGGVLEDVRDTWLGPARRYRIDLG
ncbi:GNAT family N-acetyltransferase [Dactylosporangium sp. AC04546]|uniref:GNAT family N-acetyltransferase n=1 Tax=Dactylosporangium sp. AC04546 TaxID=2862460 RepID=UPI0027E04A7D|nr:GNAT family N-acetyltransferase [Dactylosporangium sp. AC04546]WVK80304.1 GNAT family N-acetyltransferase [Dactylosporangium sp. AC04546]